MPIILMLRLFKLLILFNYAIKPNALCFIIVKPH